jgi:hypothetical protein
MAPVGSGPLQNTRKNLTARLKLSGALFAGSGSP